MLLLFFLFLVASSGAAFAVRDSQRMNPVVPAAVSLQTNPPYFSFLPKRMLVPPSGPSRRNNLALPGPGLLFNPAAVVGKKRVVPSGANPLHN